MASRSLAPLQDPLGEVLHSLRLNSLLYCRSEMTAPWGLELPPLPRCMMFHVVTRGTAWLESGRAPPKPITAGSLLLLPKGDGHRLLSAPNVRSKPLFDLPVEKLSDRYEVLRHGGKGESAQLICGVLQLSHPAGLRILESLPRLLHVDAWSAPEGEWLHSTLRLIAAETQSLKPGAEEVVTRLADILVIQTIRSWIAEASTSPRGWLAGLRHPLIGKSLAAIHRQPQAPWTLASLAREASMSRSAFAAQFKLVVGTPALQYLTEWRMQLAMSMIRESGRLAEVAEAVGYQSEAAFNRAFRRVVGTSPGGFRSRTRKDEGGPLP